MKAQNWKQNGKINDRTKKIAFATMLAKEAAEERAAGVPLRKLTVTYLNSHLADFGVWPIAQIKLKTK